LGATVLSLHCNRTNATAAGFWFEDVTFELPARETTRIGGAIREDEKQRIRSIAWSELRSAYSGLRISFSEHGAAFFRVSVVQDFPAPSRLASGAAGQSRTFGPLGGAGSISFLILARDAVYYAPAHANRGAILDGIGRGLGRAAAHELAHQILGAGARVDATGDGNAYEYGSADRASQYYGTMHWDGAWDALVKKLGR
jgi:hypothetical protein